MASLRTADPALKNYFKENYIPQVCEALLCGVIITHPEDPLRYLEEMIMVIIENGLESLLWDMCIDPSLKPKLHRLSETFLEQLFGLDDQLMTPELMIKACTFYNGNLVKTYFCAWKDLSIPLVSEEDLLAEKMGRAIAHYNFSLQKSLFHQWQSCVEKTKEKLQDAILNLQHILHYHKLKFMLRKWNEQARKKHKKREDELILKHEIQLRKWKIKSQLKTSEKSEENISFEKSLSEVHVVPDTSQCDISLLPEKAVLQDELMRHICEGCPRILYLNLSNTTITNRAMYFHNLQSLILAYCQKFTDKGLQYLNLGNGCHKLIYLDLSGCIQISVQGFRNIANSCSGIIHLTMDDMPTLTDRCVQVLVEKCQSIASVVFVGSPHISDCAFNALSTCNLRKIQFEGNKRITDASFKFTDKNYPNINHIYMADCKRITDDSLKSLLPLKQLTVLNLANCISCMNLNYLSLQNCEHVTDQGIESIVNLFSLVSLDVSGTDISNEGLISLSRHKKLKELSLSECCKITNVGIVAFCKSLLTLELLDVSYCPELSNEIVKALAIYCAGLTSLSIADCPQFTDSAIEMLSAKCHYLHILDISGCVLLANQILKDLQRGCKQLQVLKTQYCRQISREAVLEMSVVVQQQENSSDDPPHWFGYNWEGKSLLEPEAPTADKDDNKEDRKDDEDMTSR